MTSPSPNPADAPIDRDALEALRPGLRLLALRALGDAAAAEEVAQESLARAVAAAERGTLVRRGGTAAFVAGIARHVISDRQRAFSREAPLAAADGIPAESADPLERMLADDEAAEVRAALGELATGDRELLRLSYYEGHGPAEIAAMTGEPSDRIRKRKSRALERLRELLAASRNDGHDGALGPTKRVDAQTSTHASQDERP